MNEFHKVGEKRKCRVIEFNQFDGVALCSMKKSTLELEFLQHSDLKVGTLVPVTVLSIQDYGVLVRVSERMTALIPLIHLADAIIRKPAAKFKIGQKLKCRVLNVDHEKRRIHLTNKKSLVKSELPIITSYEVEPGTLTHGCIKAIKSSGVILSFYKGVTAFAPLSEISDDQSKPENLFQIGQVVQCKVLSSHKFNKKLIVTFKISDENTAEAYESLELGSLQSGKVYKKLEDCVLVQLSNGVRGRLRKYHLSDFDNLSERLFNLLKEDDELKEMLIISKPTNKMLELTNKRSLIRSHSEKKLPESIEKIQINNIYHGYIKKVSKSGVHIGFLSNTIVFAPKSYLTNQFIDDVEKHFQLGQSVRCYVIENQNGKVIVSLQQSLCATNGNEWLADYFNDEKTILTIIKEKQKNKSEKKRIKDYKVGELVTGKCSKVEEYGSIIEIDRKSNGIIINSHLGDNEDDKLEVNKKYTGKILDISLNIQDSKINHQIIDLTLKSNLLSNKKKSTVPEANKKVTATIELVKKYYLIVSVEGTDTLGYLPAIDYNNYYYFDCFSTYKIAETLKTTVNTNKFDGAYGKSLLLNNPNIENRTIIDDKPRPSSKKKNTDSVLSLTEVTVGMRITGKVEKIQTTQLKLLVGPHTHGYIHVTEALDEPLDKLAPFSKYVLNQMVEAIVLSVIDIPSNRKLPISHQNPIKKRKLLLSIRPSVLNNKKYKKNPETVKETLITWENVQDHVGKTVVGVIHEVQRKHEILLIQISPNLHGKVFGYFMSDDVSVIQNCSRTFVVGQTVNCYVVSASSEKKHVTLSLLPNTLERLKFKPGSKIPGSLKKIITSRGLIVQIGPNKRGFVHLTEIFDKYPRHSPFKALRLGEYREFYVLPYDPKNPSKNINLQIDNNKKQNKEKTEDEDKQHSAELIPLSVRISRLAPEKKIPVVNPPYSSVDELTVGQIVKGYVQSNRKGEGCIAALSKDVLVQIPHEEMADNVDENTEKYYAPPRLVTGKILSINKETKQATMTIKRSLVVQKNNKEIEKDPNNRVNFTTIAVGQKHKAYVKAVLECGVIVQLKHSKLSGLCHKSEISDKAIDWKTIFEVGDYVKVKILAIESEKKRVSFGMKPSYFTEEDHTFDSDSEEEDQMPVEEEEDKEAENNDAKDDNREEEDSKEEDEDEDEMETEEVVQSTGFKWNDFNLSKEAQASKEEKEDSAESEKEEEEKSKKKKKKTKKVKEEKKQNYEGSSKSKPETISDYEKLIIAHPNDSMIWIKYMAFLLSITEVDKARAVAERGLQRINLREEDEKLNIWVALMNLENMYGSTESLAKVLDRAITYNNPKSVYLRLIDIYTGSSKFNVCFFCIFFHTQKGDY